MSQSKTGRHWRTMPPPRRDPAEPFDGAAMMGEIDGHDHALALWHALRRALDWAAAEEPARAREYATPFPHSLEGAPAPLQFLIGPELGSARPEDVSAACLALATWAAERGYRFARRSFARAASTAHPERADAALEAARAARDTGDLAYAEVWARRAVTAARRGDQWSDYVLAYLELAEILTCRARQQYPSPAAAGGDVRARATAATFLRAARAALVKARRAAHRKTLTSLRIRAYLADAGADATLGELGLLEAEAAGRAGLEQLNGALRLLRRSDSARAELSAEVGLLEARLAVLLARTEAYLALRDRVWTLLPQYPGAVRELLDHLALAAARAEDEDGAARAARRLSLIGGMP